MTCLLAINQKAGIMIPKVIIYYIAEKRSGETEKIAKSAFVNVDDAFIYWNALADNRKRWLRMETLDGEEVIEVAHTGFNSHQTYGGYYSHATAITEKIKLPARSGPTREECMRRGWEFESIK
jgi:hypothetical protein